MSRLTVTSGVRPTCVVTVAPGEGFRCSVRALLDGLPDVRLIGEAEDGISAAILCALGRPEMVLVDAHMSWVAATDVLHHIRAASPDARIVACIDTPEMGLRAAGLTIGPALVPGPREALAAVLRRHCVEPDGGALQR